jgi:hypothetical protein
VHRSGVQRVPAFLAALLLAATLGACDQSKPGVGTAHPEVGQCHAILSPEEFDATSEASPPVPCSLVHTTQTFFVTTFPQPLAAQESRPNLQQLKATGNRLCTTKDLREYLSGRDRDGTTGLAVTSYFPSSEDWAAGSRAVRCDVAITDTDGSLKRTGINLKGALAGADSAALRLCYRQEAMDGVLSADGVDVPCSEPHTAEDISAWIAQDASLAGPLDQVARCLPYALEFLMAETLPANAVVRPVIRSVGSARTVRCAVAPSQSPTPLVTGSMAPVRVAAAPEGTTNG